MYDLIRAILLNSIQESIIAQSRKGTFGRKGINFTIQHYNVNYEPHDIEMMFNLDRGKFNGVWIVGYPKNLVGHCKTFPYLVSAIY